MEVTRNVYGDLQIKGDVPLTESEFVAALSPLLSSENRGIWLLLPFDETHMPVITAACNMGFRAHHAYKDKPNPTPAYCHHACGAAALVVNGEGKVLGIKERFDKSGLWHTPGGHVDEGEDFITAAVREAVEETGVKAVPLGIVTFYELQLPVYPPAHFVKTADDDAKMEQSIRFGTTHFSGFALCYASDDTLAPDSMEIAEAKWLDAEAFEATAHDHEAVMVRTLRTSGVLAKVGKLVRTVNKKVDGSAAELEADIRSHLVQGYSANVLHRRFPKTFEAVYYNSLPSTTFSSAVLSRASAKSLTPIGQPISAPSTPVPSTGASRSQDPILPIAAAALVVGFLAGWLFRSRTTSSAAR